MKLINKKNNQQIIFLNNLINPLNNYIVQILSIFIIFHSNFTNTKSLLKNKLNIEEKLNTNFLEKNLFKSSINLDIKEELLKKNLTFPKILPKFRWTNITEYSTFEQMMLNLNLNRIQAKEVKYKKVFLNILDFPLSGQKKQWIFN